MCNGTILAMVCRMLSWKYRQSTQFEIVKLAEHVLFRIVQGECFPQEHESSERFKDSSVSPIPR